MTPCDVPLDKSDGAVQFQFSALPWNRLLRWLGILGHANPIEKTPSVKQLILSTTFLRLFSGLPEDDCAF